MKIENALIMEEESHQRKMLLRGAKADDYAKSDKDCLSNFKVMAAIEKGLEDHGYKIPIDKPHGVAFWHMLHKMIRILNLWNEGRSPKNESIVDTHDDLSIYNDLAKECYIDYIKKEKPDAVVVPKCFGSKGYINCNYSCYFYEKCKRESHEIKQE